MAKSQTTLQPECLHKLNIPRTILAMYFLFWVFQCKLTDAVRPWLPRQWRTNGSGLAGLSVSTIQPLKVLKQRMRRRMSDHIKFCVAGLERRAPKLSARSDEGH